MRAKKYQAAETLCRHAMSKGADWLEHWFTLSSYYILDDRHRNSDHEVFRRDLVMADIMLTIDEAFFLMNADSEQVSLNRDGWWQLTTSNRVRFDAAIAAGAEHLEATRTLPDGDLGNLLIAYLRSEVVPPKKLTKKPDIKKRQEVISLLVIARATGLQWSVSGASEHGFSCVDLVAYLMGGRPAATTIVREYLSDAKRLAGYVFPSLAG